MLRLSCEIEPAVNLISGLTIILFNLIFQCFLMSQNQAATYTIINELQECSEFASCSVLGSTRHPVR